MQFPTEIRPDIYQDISYAGNSGIIHTSKSKQYGGGLNIQLKGFIPGIMPFTPEQFTSALTTSTSLGILGAGSFGQADKIEINIPDIGPIKLVVKTLFARPGLEEFALNEFNAHKIIFQVSGGVISELRNHLIPAFAVGTSGSMLMQVYHIFFPFEEGVTLHTYINKAIRERLGITIFEAKTITDALEVDLHIIHHIGLLHRDIKPDNIYVTSNSLPDGTTTHLIKLIDLGLAAPINFVGRVGAGAREYRSPAHMHAILNGIPVYKYTVADDLYAFNKLEENISPYIIAPATNIELPDTAMALTTAALQRIFPSRPIPGPGAAGGNGTSRFKKTDRRRGRKLRTRRRK